MAKFLLLYSIVLIDILRFGISTTTTKTINSTNGNIREPLKTLSSLFTNITSSMVDQSEDDSSVDSPFKLNPPVITIENLESLLRQPSEVFRPSYKNVINTTDYLTEPNQVMQPPSNEPYNFYMPQYEHILTDDYQVKLDEKSRKMKKISPPPVLRQPKHIYNIVYHNYYNLKPKKLPKKYDGDLKTINYKWLNGDETIKRDNFKNLVFDEKQSNKFTPDLSQIVYLMNDEQHRINFDDSFFTMDSVVPQQSHNRMDFPFIYHSGRQDKNYLNKFYHQDYITSDEGDLMTSSSIQQKR